MKGNKLEVVQTWALDEAASTICFSPDGETLLLTSNTVSVLIIYHNICIYMICVTTILLYSFIIMYDMFYQK